MTVSGTVAKIRRLMPTDPSRTINPLRLAKAKEKLDGHIQIDSMERLKGLLFDYDGELQYSSSFDIDENGLCSIDLEIMGSVTLECQRCLKPFVADIKKRSLLGVVRDKAEANALATEYEPLLLSGETFLLDELVEDELLLAIPISPSHPASDCSGQKELDRINEDGKLKPFSVLASLKKDSE